ncbi:prepilin peptidase [Cryobacterium zhongshanensis]|uniref:A24 family peptidase n=1 Tax=Cryobacterium zhongshanensis TaxID=2928153 RepID=A0AA41UMF0_9MICO|nr:A24 family peptidase [Cryobacterium zhongshanensis]MCI4659781.1 A24 family peptidase [Cryobacterium zhongshanensis]
MTDFLLGLMMGSPENVVPTTTISVVIVGMLVLAALDVWRREVEDYATAALFGIAVVGAGLEGVHPQQWVGALLAAGIAFTVYLGLGRRGIMGGGDVKLSIVPAFVLGLSNPIIGLWWIACAIVLHQTFFAVNTRLRKAPLALPHVPAMALATLVASIAFPVHI